MVFQQHHLLPQLTVLETVMLPFMDNVALVGQAQYRSSSLAKTTPIPVGANILCPEETKKSQPIC